MNLVLRVALPLNARLLPKTRQAIAGYLEAAGPSSETIHDVILAVDEACANVIRHAFPGEDGQYEVCAVMDGDEVRISVEDHGVGFDPDRLDQDWVHPEEVSGRGLSIIRSVMTSVDLEQPSPEGGTRLVMRKKLH